MHSGSRQEDTQAANEAVRVADTELRAGALGLPGVLMQAITHTAPATALLFTIQFTTAQAGPTAPLAYLLAFLIVAVLGVSLIQLAKHFPSAGGYYTYVSRTIHPRAGFLTAWLYFLYDPTTSGYSLAYIGSVCEKALMAEYGLVFPWWMFLLILGAFVGMVTYRGIELSTWMLVLFGCAQILIVLLLSFWGFFHPGSGGFDFSSFNPRNAPSSGGLYLAVIFSIFALTGWEGVAPLAEESENPRKTLPRAIFISILFMGCFLVICSWGLLVGWGTQHLRGFSESPVNPTFVMAKKFWGGAWVVVILALINSMIAVSIASNNAAARVWFAMGRSGSLPHALAKVHPRFKTPVTAVTLQIVVMFAVGLGLGLLIGPENEFVFMGTVTTFALIFVYSAGNLGVLFYHYREHRPEFSLVLHAAFPLVGTAALFFVGYSSLSPWPPSPAGYAPWVVGIWLLLGVLVLVRMRLKGKEDWLLKAGLVAHERAETMAEAKHRHLI